MKKHSYEYALGGIGIAIGFTLSYILQALLW